MLLTSLPVDGTFKSQWRVVEGYLSRLRIEETTRFVKQSYGFENIRVMTYVRIRNMASLVLSSAYFAMAWIGRNIRREVLAEHLARLGKRLSEVPEFAAYAIADGIKRAFARFGKWVRTTTDAIAKATDVSAIQLLPGFAELFDADDGQPFRTRNAENNMPKRTSAFIHMGAAHFHAQKWVNSSRNKTVHSCA